MEKFVLLRKTFYFFCFYCFALSFFLIFHGIVLFFRTPFSPLHLYKERSIQFGSNVHLRCGFSLLFSSCTLMYPMLQNFLNSFVFLPYKYLCVYLVLFRWKFMFERTQLVLYTFKEEERKNQKKNTTFSYYSSNFARMLKMNFLHKNRILVLFDLFLS